VVRSLFSRKSKGPHCIAVVKQPTCTCDVTRVLPAQRLQCNVMPSVIFLFKVVLYVLVVLPNICSRGQCVTVCAVSLSPQRLLMCQDTRGECVCLLVSVAQSFTHTHWIIENNITDIWPVSHTLLYVNSLQFLPPQPFCMSIACYFSHLNLSICQ
jgi:hypothetical protein